MDQGKELEEERNRRLKLEKDLAALQDRIIGKLSPEELASTIHAQQLDSLTYHLLKCRQRISELEAELKSKDSKLEAELKSKDRELEKARETMESLEDEMDSKRVEFEELKEGYESEKPEPAGQRTSAAGMVSDEELDELLESVVSERPRLRPKASKRTFRDFVRLLRRMERIKLFDASLLLDMSQEEVLKWAGKLEGKGYVAVEGGRHDRMLIATKKLLSTR